MIFAYILAWAITLWIASRSASRFLFFFVICQFLFVGLGLTLFPLVGLSRVVQSFPAFRIENLGVGDFSFANLLVLLGCGTAVLLVRGVESTRGGEKKAVGEVSSQVQRGPYYLCSLVAYGVSFYFIIKNYSSYQMLLMAVNPDVLTDFVDLRYQAVSNYLVTLLVYNFAPAVSLLALLNFSMSRRRKDLLVFVFSFVVTATALALTFQKRPLMVYVGACVLLWYLFERWRQGLDVRIDYKRLLARGWIYVPLMIGVVFFFYYVQTGHRFYMSFVETIPVLLETIVTRIVGRLSLPAAMYVDFFPNFAPHYGLTNVGLFSTLFGFELFEDSRVVFAAYAYGGQIGAVAASVFIDAYGQGGVPFVILYGIIVAALILGFDRISEISENGPKRIYSVVFGVVFFYYLSQASVYRSALGYGGVFYWLVWAWCIKRSVEHWNAKLAR
jgi:hypothetical protein